MAFNKKGKYEDIDVTLKDYGPLYIKGILKILAILFLTIEFIPGMGLIGNWWLVLIVLFFFYFQLPASYSNHQPYKAVEGWVRMLIGFFLALFIFFALSPSGSIGPTKILQLLSLSIIAVGIAFLFSYGFRRRAGVVGFIIMSGLMFILFNYFNFGSTLPQAAPIFFLTLAFFFVPPESKDKSREIGERFNLKYKW